MAGLAKKKCLRLQCNEEYLQYGFIKNSADPKQLFCIKCHQPLSNEATKPSPLLEDMRRKRSENVGKHNKYFEGLKTDFENQNTVESLFKKQTKKINDGRLIVSNKTAEIIVKTCIAHPVAEKINVPAVETVNTRYLTYH